MRASSRSSRRRGAERAEESPGEEERSGDESRSSRAGRSSTSRQRSRRSGSRSRASRRPRSRSRRKGADSPDSEGSGGSSPRSRPGRGRGGSRPSSADGRRAPAVSEVLGSPQEYMVHKWLDWRAKQCLLPPPPGLLREEPRGYALLFDSALGLAPPFKLQLAKAAGTLLSVRLHITFFNFTHKRFFGNTLATRAMPAAADAADVDLADAAFWHTDVHDVDTVAVAEVVAVETASRSSQPPRQVGLGWSLLDVYAGRGEDLADVRPRSRRSRRARDRDTLRESKLYSGTPRALLFADARDALETALSGREISGALLRWRLQAFPDLVRARRALPPDLLVGATTPIPGIQPLPGDPPPAEGGRTCLADPARADDAGVQRAIVPPRLDEEEARDLSFQGVALALPARYERRLLDSICETYELEHGIGAAAERVVLSGETDLGASGRSAASESTSAAGAATAAPAATVRASATVLRRRLRLALHNGLGPMGGWRTARLFATGSKHPRKLRGGRRKEERSRRSRSSRRSRRGAGSGDDSGSEGGEGGDDDAAGGFEDDAPSVDGEDPSGVRRSRSRKRGDGCTLEAAHDLDLRGYQQHPLVAVVARVEYDVVVGPVGAAQPAAQEHTYTLGSAIFVPSHGAQLYLRNTGLVEEGDKTPTEPALRLPLDTSICYGITDGFVYADPQAEQPPALTVEKVEDPKEPDAGASLPKGALQPRIREPDEESEPSKGKAKDRAKAKKRDARSRRDRRREERAAARKARAAELSEEAQKEQEEAERNLRDLKRRLEREATATEREVEEAAGEEEALEREKEALEARVEELEGGMRARRRQRDEFLRSAGRAKAARRPRPRSRPKPRPRVRPRSESPPEEEEEEEERSVRRRERPVRPKRVKEVAVEEEEEVPVPPRPPTPPQDSLLARALNLSVRASQKAGDEGPRAAPSVGRSMSRGPAAEPSVPVELPPSSSVPLSRAARARLSAAGFDDRLEEAVGAESADGGRPRAVGPAGVDVTLEAADPLCRHRISLHFAAFKALSPEGGVLAPDPTKGPADDGEVDEELPATEGGEGKVADPADGASEEGRGPAGEWQPRRVYFTFQFYALPPQRTPPLRLGRRRADRRGRAPEQPFLLLDDDEGGSGGRGRGRAPEPVVLDVDTSLLAADESVRFARYLAARHLAIEVWDADSLMQIGTATVPLRRLMRQQRTTCELAAQFDVVAPVEQEAPAPESGEAGPAVVGSLQLLALNRGMRGHGSLLPDPRAEADSSSAGLPDAKQQLQPQPPTKPLSAWGALGPAPGTVQLASRDAAMAVGAAAFGADRAQRAMRQRVKARPLAQRSRELASLLEREGAALRAHVPFGGGGGGGVDPSALTQSEFRAVCERFAVRGQAGEVAWRRLLQWLRRRDYDPATEVAEDRVLGKLRGRAEEVEEAVARMVDEEETTPVPAGRGGGEDPTGSDTRAGGSGPALTQRQLRRALARAGVKVDEEELGLLLSILDAEAVGVVPAAGVRDLARGRDPRSGDGAHSLARVQQMLQRRLGAMARKAARGHGKKGRHKSRRHRRRRRHGGSRSESSSGSGEEDEEDLDAEETAETGGGDRSSAAEGDSEAERRHGVEAMRRAFAECDDTGRVTRGEFERAVDALRLDLEPAETAVLVRELEDGEGDGAIDVTAFEHMVWGAPLELVSARRKLQQALRASHARARRAQAGETGEAGAASLPALLSRWAAHEQQLAHAAPSGGERSEGDDPSRAPAAISEEGLRRALMACGLALTSDGGAISEPPAAGPAPPSAPGGVRASMSARQLQRLKQLEGSPRGARAAAEESPEAAMEARQRALEMARLYREGQKRQLVRSLMQEATSREVRLFPSFGQTCFFECTLRNPFAHEERFRVRCADPELRLVTDAAEWRYLQRSLSRAAGDPYGRVEEDMVSGDREVSLRAGEAVNIPFAFLSVASGLLPYDPREAPELVLAPALRGAGDGGVNNGLRGGGDGAWRGDRRPRGGEGKEEDIWSDGEDGEAWRAPRGQAHKGRRHGGGAGGMDPPTEEAPGIVSPGCGAAPAAITPRTIEVAFESASHGQSVLLLHVHITPRPFAVDRRFRFFHPEGQMLRRSLRLSGPGAAPASRRYAHCPDDDVAVEWRAGDEGATEGEVGVRHRCGRFPARRGFHVLVYGDPFRAVLQAVLRVDVFAVRRLDANVAVGQVCAADLVLRGGRRSQMVQCYSSAPHEVVFRPPGPFQLQAGAYNRSQLLVRPLREGLRYVLVNMVDRPRQELVCAWQVTLNATPPAVAKTFDLRVQHGARVAKKLSYTNLWDRNRAYEVHSGEPALVHVKEPALRLGPHQSGFIRLAVDARVRPGVHHVYIFVNDEYDQNEECLLLNVTVLSR